MFSKRLFQAAAKGSKQTEKDANKPKKELECDRENGADPPATLTGAFHTRLLHELDVLHYGDWRAQNWFLGSGAFAEVHLGRLAATGECVAVKRFSDSSVTSIEREIRIHKYMEQFIPNTPRILGLLPSGRSLQNVSLVFEYVANSQTLHDWKTSEAPVSRIQWLSVVLQMAETLEVMHRKCVLHNDLHSDNVLIAMPGEEAKFAAPSTACGFQRLDRTDSESDEDEVEAEDEGWLSRILSQSGDRALPKVTFIDFGHATFRRGKFFSFDYDSESKSFRHLAPEVLENMAELTRSGHMVVVKQFTRSSFPEVRYEALINLYLNDTGWVPRFYGVAPRGSWSLRRLGIVQELFADGVTLGDVLKSVPESPARAAAPRHTVSGLVVLMKLVVFSSCECPARELQLGPDNHTCSAIGEEVICGADSMVLTFEKVHYQSLHKEHLTLSDVSCRATDNATHIILRAPLTGCGTTSQMIGTTIIYKNVVRSQEEVVDGIISRVKEVEIPFQCVMTLEEGIDVPIAVDMGELHFLLEGTGTHNVDLQFSNNGTFHPGQGVVSVYPGQNIWAKASLHTADPDLVVAISNCSATNSSNHNSTSTPYTIMTKGLRFFELRNWPGNYGTCGAGRVIIHIIRRVIQREAPLKSHP
nr:hypothetical protein BaRGS_005979 [Batillaria attramentaria]